MKKICLFLSILVIALSIPLATMASNDQSSGRFVTANIEEPVGAESNAVAPYAIIGSDDRVKVSSANLKKHPYNAVALLKVEFPNRTIYTSGFFYNKTTVITAGHCIYSTSDGGYANKITVYTSTGTSYVASRFVANPAWNGGTSTNATDYGVVKISSNQGSLFGANFTSDVTEFTLNVTGYPDNNTVMYTATGDATSNSSTFFTHGIDTTGGQSGSPVYYTTSAGGYVVGIHTGGSAAGQYNVAVRFNQSVRDWCLNA